MNCLTDMAFIELREKSFKKWPFTKGPCTKLEMARAGFFVKKVNNCETVACYYCFKELEGWESTDIPFIEHKKHASYCAYIQRFDQSPEELTAEDVMYLECARLRWHAEVLSKEVDSMGTLLQESFNPEIKRPAKRTGRKRKDTAI